MKGRRLCALSALALVVACQDQKVPTALSGRSAPGNPSAVISDGAHGGNPDFFFLPPMVSNPANIPPPTNYEPGKFNATLAPSLSVDICQLQDAPVDAQGLPVAATPCVAGLPKKRFPAGTVQLQAGTPDGFYQVIWHTQESDLDVTKYYRIKVNVLGSSMSFGAADIDPVANMKEFRNVRTGEVIPLNDDATLPINFRIENAGGPTLCDGVALCTSVVVTNVNQQVVQVQGNAGPIAGAVFPDGWLPPPPGPQSVIVTIKNFNTGTNDVFAGTQATPCHAGLTLQQFNGCFTFTTTPHLDGLAPGGHQFMREVTVVTCYVLHDNTSDPRERWVQQWSSGQFEAPHPLKSVGDGLVLTAQDQHNCGSNFETGELVSNATGSSALTRFASNGWRALKGAIGGFLGVKTAYAVDLGLGGSTLDFSNIGPALTAQMATIQNSPTNLGVQPPGGGLILAARIVGTVFHREPLPTTGIGTIQPTLPLPQTTFGLPMTFTVETANGGTLLPYLATPLAATPTLVTELTNPSAMNPDDTASTAWAAVTWTLPFTPGTYKIKAKSTQAKDSVIFTATVSAGLPNPILSFTGSEFYSVNDVNFVRYNLAVTNYQAYPASMFAAAPDLPPCGLNTSASRTWINIYDASNDSYIYGFCAFGSPSDLQGIWFAEPVGTPAPDQVYIKMIDRAANVTYTSNSVHPIPPP
jgi:hypothetical protein